MNKYVLPVPDTQISPIGNIQILTTGATRTYTRVFIATKRSKKTVFEPLINRSKTVFQGSINERNWRGQCASSQFLPIPQSAIRGTDSFTTPSISLSTSARTRSASSWGTLKFSSSCTCIIICVRSFSSFRR